MHRVKARLLLEESLFGRNIAKRHAFNFKLLQGGEYHCRESMQQFLDAGFPGAKVVQLDTMGMCTVRVTENVNTENEKVYYVKQLDQRQYNYYIQYERFIKPIHAPYILLEDDGHFFQVMPNFGKRSRFVTRERAERMNEWALKQLEYLHNNGLYHGDIITGEYLKINEGNILISENGEIRLIDFGPLVGEERTDEKLKQIEIGMLREYHNPLQNGSTERPPPTPRRHRPPSQTPGRRRTRPPQTPRSDGHSLPKRRRMQMKYDELLYDLDPDELW